MSKEAIQAKIDEFNKRYEGKKPTPVNVATFLEAWVNELLGLKEGAEDCLCVIADIYPDGNQIPVGIALFKPDLDIAKNDSAILKIQNPEPTLLKRQYATEQEAQP